MPKLDFLISIVTRIQTPFATYDLLFLISSVTRKPDHCETQNKWFTCNLFFPSTEALWACSHHNLRHNGKPHQANSDQELEVCTTHETILSARSSKNDISHRKRLSKCRSAWPFRPSNIHLVSKGHIYLCYINDINVCPKIWWIQVCLLFL